MVSPDLRQQVIRFDEVDSTNNYLKHHYTRLPHGTVVQTDFQTSGRGQFERQWYSNKGDNALFSILLKEHVGQEDINPIVIAALISTLKQYQIDATFKYPNDIYVQGQKIAGILIETKYKDNKLEYMIIGIGLNVNQTQFDQLNATSIKNKSNKTQDINSVMECVLSYIENNLLLLKLLKGDKHEY